LGIAYAGLGRREEAIREGLRGVELVDDTIWFYQRPGRVLNLARIYMLVGDYDDAVQQLETLPTERGLVTPAWLGADLLWEPLRDHPRFRALIEKSDQPTRKHGPTQAAARRDPPAFGLAGAGGLPRCLVRRPRGGGLFQRRAIGRWRSRSSRLPS